jgi:hypothetical protein
MVSGAGNDHQQQYDRNHEGGQYSAEQAHPDGPQGGQGMLPPLEGLEQRQSGPQGP